MQAAGRKLLLRSADGPPAGSTATESYFAIGATLAFNCVRESEFVIRRMLKRRGIKE